MELTWESYLARGWNPIYHMCQKEDLDRQIHVQGNDRYYPPSFNQEGFVHCTSDPKLLLAVGNNFYKESKGEWICLELNTRLIDGIIKYEDPANVGDKKTHAVDAKFPHVFCGLPKQCIWKYHDIRRGENGEFLSISDVV